VSTEYTPLDAVVGWVNWDNYSINEPVISNEISLKFDGLKTLFYQETKF